MARTAWSGTAASHVIAAGLWMHQPSSAVTEVAASILIATSRSSRVSRARYTSPKPPAPTAARISYGPMRVPIERAKRGEYSRLGVEEDPERGRGDETGELMAS